MEFMLLLVDRKGAPAGDAGARTELGRFADELRRQGKLKATVPLRPAPTGARVEVRDGKAVVTEGAFTSSPESVVGSFVVDVADRAEAIEVATRCPHARAGTVEVRLVPDRDVVRAPAPSTYMFLLHMDPHLEDADGGKYREMLAYDDTLKREGVYVESSQLALDPPPARVEVRDGSPLVIDGPFAETKEVAGGYYLVQAPSRAEAIELAKRCPHARWGSAEVRELATSG